MLLQIHHAVLLDLSLMSNNSCNLCGIIIFIYELCTSVVTMTNTRVFAHMCGYGCGWQQMLHIAG